VYLVIPQCLALAAAALFGVASVCEQRSTKQVTERRVLSLRLLVDLVRRPLFLAAIGMNIAGSALQILALHGGSLAVVQPLLVLNLPFTVVFAAVSTGHRAPDRLLLAGAACCAAGIAGFLEVAWPHGGSDMASSAAALPLATALAAVVATCLAAGRWGPRLARPLWLALACGADFGVSAFLLKIIPGTLALGFADPLRQWPLYLAVIVTPTGFLLNQNAFQAGARISPVLAVITSADPLVSITIGAVCLHETIASTPLALASEAVSLAVMIGGILAVARRAPRLIREAGGTRSHPAGGPARSGGAPS
jgi:drug/metabolite transporter (DMT)-like permease